MNTSVEFPRTHCNCGTFLPAWTLPPASEVGPSSGEWAAVLQRDRPFHQNLQQSSCKGPGLLLAVLPSLQENPLDS